jgi:hydroxyacylglutathione hydrolase
MNLLPIPAFSDNYIWMLHDADMPWSSIRVAEPVLSTLHSGV